MAKNDTAFEQWFGETLTRYFKPEPHEEAVSDYFSWMSGLPLEAKLAASGEITEVPEPVPSEASKRYGIVICPDGEPPTFRLCGSPQIQANQVGLLEGQDVFVALFIGHVVRLTKGPHRLLVFPDNSAISVPRFTEDEPVFVDIPDSVEFEEDGFLGPPELFITDSRIADDEEEAEDDEV